MGIKGLNNILRRECKSVFRTTHLSEFMGCRVAVDISVFLYTYIRSIGEPGWINAIISMFCVLKKHRIKAICIFDGPNPPPEKKMEQVYRREQTAKNKERLEIVCKLKQKIDEEYASIHKKIPDSLHPEIKNVLGRGKIKEEEDGFDYSNAHLLVDALGKKEWTITKQVIPITKEHGALVREFLDIMGIVHMTPDGEAETLCAWLAYHGKVDAVLSSDTDVLVYGTPIFLSGFESQNETVVVVKYQDVLNGLHMDSLMFRDLCIFCRCDYNKHEPAVTMVSAKGKTLNIGPIRALQLIRDFKSFEAIEANKGSIDLGPLKWRVCRKRFYVPSVLDVDCIVPYVGNVKPEQLILFLERVGSNFDQTYIEMLWKPVEIEMVD